MGIRAVVLGGSRWCERHERMEPLSVACDVPIPDTAPAMTCELCGGAIRLSGSGVQKICGVCFTPARVFELKRSLDAAHEVMEGMQRDRERLALELGEALGEVAALKNVLATYQER